MADLRKRCPECKRQFRPRKGTRRVYCETCRPPRAEPLGSAVIPIATPAATDALPPLVEAAMAELASVGREATPEGIIVLTLAAQIAAGGGSASGLAALVREFHSSKAKALEGAAKEADVIDGIFGATG